MGHMVGDVSHDARCVWTHQRFGHHHLDLLLRQHGELGEQTLDDELPGLELRVDGDARHGGYAGFLPRGGGRRGGGAASTHAADRRRSCEGRERNYKLSV